MAAATVMAKRHHFRGLFPRARRRGTGGVEGGGGGIRDHACHTAVVIDHYSSSFASPRPRDGARTRRYLT